MTCSNHFSNGNRGGIINIFSVGNANLGCNVFSEFNRGITLNIFSQGNAGLGINLFSCDCVKGGINCFMIPLPLCYPLGELDVIPDPLSCGRAAEVAPGPAPAAEVAPEPAPVVQQAMNREEPPAPVTTPINPNGGMAVPAVVHVEA